MSARNCCVPGCLVLLTTAAPMCQRHLGRVSQELRRTLDRGPKDPGYEGALTVAKQQAQKNTTNMGRTGATYPNGPTIA